MSTVKLPNVRSFQDNPPPGGYPRVPLQRGIRPRGPPGWLIWASIITATVYGFYQIGQAGAKNRLTIKEKREARMATMPYLQAEKDQEMVLKINARLAEEADIMKGNPDWVVGASVYSKKRGL